MMCCCTREMACLFLAGCFQNLSVCFSRDTWKCSMNWKPWLMVLVLALVMCKIPSLPLVKHDAKYRLPLDHFFGRVPSKRKAFAWGEGKQAGRKFVLVDSNTPFLSPSVEVVSCQQNPVSGCGCIIFLAPNHRVVWIPCCLDVLGMTLGRCWKAGKSFDKIPQSSIPWFRTLFLLWTL